MADDSDLDYLRTFLGKVHTTATVKHYGEVGNIDDEQGYAAATSRILIFPPETLSCILNEFTKIFKVKLAETNEANINTALRNIATGCYKLNRGITITEYTRPANFMRCRIASTNNLYMNKSSGRCLLDLVLDCDVK